MTETELAELRAAWKARAEKEEKEAAERRNQALIAAQKAAVWLRSNYGTQKVYLFGSLAWGKFDVHSDIDLYVEGFPPDKSYWRMLAELEEFIAPFQPQVVTAEDAVPSLQIKVTEKGVEL